MSRSKVMKLQKHPFSVFLAHYLLFSAYNSTITGFSYRFYISFESVPCQLSSDIKIISFGLIWNFWSEFSNRYNFWTAHDREISQAFLESTHRNLPRKVYFKFLRVLVVNLKNVPFFGSVTTSGVMKPQPSITAYIEGLKLSFKMTYGTSHGYDWFWSYL